MSSKKEKKQKKQKMSKSESRPKSTTKNVESESRPKSTTKNVESESSLAKITQKASKKRKNESESESSPGETAQKTSQKQTKQETHKRKNVERESERSLKETTQIASKKQKTVDQSSAVSERRITRQDSSLTRTIRDLRISSDSDPGFRSEYSLKDVPSRASKFTEEDVDAFNATFESTSDENNFIPDVEATNLPNQYLLPNIDRDFLEKKKFDVHKLNTSDIYVMQFFKTLHRVVMNAGLDIGTEESKTDSLVNLLLTRACGFDGWPFGVRVKETYRLFVSDKKVTADPDFVVDMEEIAIIVTEDKHLKDVSAPEFGEAQILAEILACGFDNLNQSKELIHQTLYAIRVISSYVTFYKAEIPVAYWRELKRGIPRNQSIKILRWPGENNKESGLDLAVPEERRIIFEAIIKIRQSLSASSTTTPTTTSIATSSSTSITAHTEQSSKKEGKKTQK